MKYLSLFSGIGGFEYGIQQSKIQMECIGFSEIDKYAKSIYKKHFPDHTDLGDARKIRTDELPDFDILVGGFPCQAFSIAGKRKGFNDTRGTLFFEIARVLRDKRPRYFLLENVKGLLSHDKGKTFQTILTVLTEMGYLVQWEVLNSKDFDVPQNRERVFIKGYLGRYCGREVLFTGRDCEEDSKTVIDINKIGNVFPSGGQSGNVYTTDGVSVTLSANGGGAGGKTGLYLVPDERKIKVKGNISPSGYKESDVLEEDGLSKCLKAGDYKNPIKVAQPVLTPDRINKRQNGRRMKNDGEPSFTLTASDRHGVYDGCRIRKLTPLECERLQSFPDNWTKYGVDGELISDTQRYKCCGNAVTTNVITYLINEMFS